MTWAPTETQKAIYDVLSNDSDLIDLLGGANRVFNYVPDNTTYPYVRFDVLPFEIRDNYTWDGLEVEFQVSSFARALGDKQVQDIQKRIDELIHKANLTIDGWNIISLRRTIITIETEDDNKTKMGIQRFKLMIGES